MSKGVMAAGIIMLGVLTFGLINIISNYTTGNELDFQLLRDTTESAMLDAVDLGFFQTSGGQIRMDKEKFVEVRVGSSTMATFADVSFNIENRVDAIIETKYTDPRTLDEVTNYD